MSLSNMDAVWIKRNGKWVYVDTFYQKVNGAWVQITVDECRTILSSNNCKT